MKKLLAVMVMLFLLSFGSTSVFADPGGGTKPNEPEVIVTPTEDPGGGTKPY
jgi:hypothetical protein